MVEEVGRGAAALRYLRETAAEQLCDITTPASEDSFSFSAAFVPLGQSLLIDERISTARYDRTSRHIARGSIDHYLITLCVDGAMTFATGRRNVTVRPGDLCVMDMAQANIATHAADARAGFCRSLVLVLPRPVLAPMLAAPDAAGASLISHQSRHAQLLAGQFFALRRGNKTGAGAGTEASGVLAGTIAEAIGSARGAEAVIERADRHMLLAAIKRHIDAKLHEAMPSAEQICRRFGLSRATLYRLFEPEGGLWRYIQDQRLHRAFLRLATPGSPRAPIIDLAIEFGFGSNSAFVRAFRRRFGLTPGEVKQLAEMGALRQTGDGSDAGGLALLQKLGQ